VLVAAAVAAERMVAPVEQERTAKAMLAAMLLLNVWAVAAALVAQERMALTAEALVMLAVLVELRTLLAKKYTTQAAVAAAVMLMVAYLLTVALVAAVMVRAMFLL
jgi:hypothetical protein